MEKEGAGDEKQSCAAENWMGVGRVAVVIDALFITLPKSSHPGRSCTLARVQSGWQWIACSSEVKSIHRATIAYDGLGWSRRNV